MIILEVINSEYNKCARIVDTTDSNQMCWNSEHCRFLSDVLE